MGEALRFRKGLYRIISDNIPADMEQRMANGIERAMGKWSCWEKK
jgi:hypothetical protein